jgi:hypothetical protein
VIDGLKTLTQNLSDKTDDLLALNVETYNLLHDFNVNGTGMIAADADIYGCALDAMAMIDQDRIDGITMTPRFYDTSYINCGYGGVNVYAGRIIDSMYVSNPTSYKSFDLNTLQLSSSFTLTADNNLCGRKTSTGAMDFYADYSGTYVMMKTVDTAFTNLASVNTAQTYAGFNYYSSKYPTRFLNTWVSTNPYLSWVTRPNIYSPITVETKSYNISTGAEISAASYQLPYFLYSSNVLANKYGEFINTNLNTYSSIYSKHGDYILMMMTLFGKRFLGVLHTTDGKIYYIDTDILFLFGSLMDDVTPYISWTQPAGLDYDGQYIPTTDTMSAQIMDFMQTSGYFHLIIKLTTGFYYYLRFAY